MRLASTAPDTREARSQPSDGLARSFTPFSLRGLSLRNRWIKSATFEGSIEDGAPGPEVVAHHERLARGGVAMTTLAYCAVEPDGRTFEQQIVLDRASLPRLAELTRRVHMHGGAVSAQLSHAGYFTRNPRLSTWLPRGASLGLNEYGLASGKAIAWPASKAEIAARTRAFAEGARIAIDAGFDAVEIHMGHGYLLSQFISPKTNRRSDEYGGRIEGRMRLPLEVVAAVREAVGADVPVLAKTNLSDGFEGGLEIDEAVEGARLLEQSGVDALVLSGGFTSKSPFFLLRGGRPLEAMVAVEKSPLQKLALRVFGPKVVREVPFEPLFFLPLAQRVRAAVRMPLVYLGGVTGPRDVARVMDEGFELCAMARCLVADPEMPARVRTLGDAYETRCNRCNECVARMDAPGGVACVRA